MVSFRLFWQKRFDRGHNWWCAAAVFDGSQLWSLMPASRRSAHASPEAYAFLSVVVLPQAELELEYEILSARSSNSMFWFPYWVTASNFKRRARTNPRLCQPFWMFFNSESFVRLHFSNRRHCWFWSRSWPTTWYFGSPGSGALPLRIYLLVCASPYSPSPLCQLEWH